jgi:hypothetical protein
MYRNYRLYAAIAILALVGATIKGDGDWFEGLRPRERQAAQGGNGEPVGVVFERVETEGGDDALRLKPVEGTLDTLGEIFGGNRHGDRAYRRYDNYRE